MRAAAFTLFLFSLLPLGLVRPYFCILLYFWLSLMNPHRLMYAVALPYAEITAVVAVVCWLFSTETKRIPVDRTSILLVMWLAWTGVTTYFALNPYGPSGAIDKFVTFSKIIGFSLLAYSTTTNRRRVDALLTVLVLSVGYFGLKGGLWSLLTGGQSRVYGPEESLISDNNDLGSALVMILPLMAYLRRVYVHKWVKLGLSLMIAFTTVGVFFTYSRASFLAMAGLGLFFTLKSRHRFRYLGLAAAAIVLMLNFAPAAWFDRMNTIENYQVDELAELRIYMWKLSLAVVRARPILGGGFRDAFVPAAVNPYAEQDGLPDLDRRRAPHSIYFEALGEHGIPGLLLFLSIIASTWMNARYLVSRAKRNPQIAWADQLGRMVQASLAGFCIAGAFGTLATYDGFYVVVIACAAARRVVAQVQPKSQKIVERRVPTFRELPADSSKSV